MLRYVADLSEAMVAGALGCSIGSVKTHASRGLAGDPGGRGGSFVPTADDVGTVTCEGVIVGSTDHWVGSIVSVGRLTNVPPVSFTVAPVPPDTSTSSSTNPSSTTTTTAVGS